MTEPIATAAQQKNKQLDVSATQQKIKQQDPQGQNLEVPDDLVELGYIADAYGIRGLVKVQPHSSQADVLLKVKQWWLQQALSVSRHLREKRSHLPSNQFPLRPVSLLMSKRHSDVLVAQVAGIDDRTQAEALAGHTIWVSRAAFPVAAENEYYWVDLIGLAAFNLQGEPLGQVLGLLENNAHPVLRLQIDQDCGEPVQERLVPFVAAYVHEVDLVKKRITLDWGLDY